MADSSPTVNNFGLGASLLELAKSWLPVLSVVVGALWGLYTYMDHQKTARNEAAASLEKQLVRSKEQTQRDTRVRLIEAQKPFLDKQLALYFETAQIVGKLVTEPLSSPDWEASTRRFWQLYWSELTMVEHNDVATAMKAFGDQLGLVAEGRDKLKGVEMDAALQILRSLSLNVAHALRRGVESSWGASGSNSQAIVAP